MKSFPTLSIVTPVYNLEQYVAQTIESVISQEGDFFIDYIVIDDGSIDSSLEIIKKYSQLIESGKWNIKCRGINFRYFTGPNHGQTQAYNRGFRISTGQLCAWMNADDYYMPGIFQKISSLYNKNPDIHFIYGNCLKVYGMGIKESSTEPLPRPDETLKSLLTRGNSFDLCFFSKDIFDEVGPLDESLKYCVDLDFWFRIFAKSKVVYLPETIGAFRLRNESNTMTKRSQFAEERKMLAKRYGGNIIPARNIYKLRGKIYILNTLQKASPLTYSILKKLFYKLVDLFKYN